MCPHDDDPNSCPPCQSVITTAEPDNAGPVFAARFSSTCPACEWPIDPNDECRMFDGRAMHRTCAEIESRAT